MREPVVQVHVGAVEERVALADHGDIAPGIEMRGHHLGRRVVEVGDHALVAERRLERLGGDGVDQRQLQLRLVQMRLDDAVGIALLALGDEVGHHRRGAQVAHRFQGQQLRVAGADADAEQAAARGALPARCGASLAVAHSTSVARALTAAAAIALPPRRPFTTT